MVGTITYDVTNNVITAVGGTVGAPIGFIDLWNADKAGTLDLHARTGISAVDANPVNLTRNLRPTDYFVLGGAANDLYMIVANWVNMTTATIRFIGTDTAGNAQTEDLVVTGNGTCYATKYFRTLTQSQVTVFTQSDSGTFDYTVQQGQWGVVWKQGTSQFVFECKLIVGDGSTATYLTDTNKEVLIQNISLGTYQAWCTLKNYAFVTFGTLVDATDKVTSSGCSFIFAATKSNSALFMGSDVSPRNETLYLYSCSAYAPAGGGDLQLLYLGSTCRVYNSMFVGGMNIARVTMDIFNVQVSCSYTNCGFDAVNGTLNRIMIVNCKYGYRFLTYNGYPTITDSFAVYDLYVRNAVGVSVSAENYAAAKDVYLVNPDLDVWNVGWTGSGGNRKVYRQYTFDLVVTDKAGVPIENATVTLKDKDGNTVFSTTTDVNGAITQQTVSRGYYNQANGSTLQEYSPHTLTISKAGYQTYVKKFTLEKTKWEIKLAKTVPLYVSPNGLALNLNPAEPENKTVMIL